ncbi:hypothetical protein BXZ70DRAFT_890392 [Cristinia sonorae]|uniref:Uncharacterized protein n=1 Tax=Cristinia sonorae TaxID=1940300 RepID=A0A8K0URX2_9AGAR|nr:hypothetical protein BXZ70DRAFT_890392 [Cristinia sonorae]
MTVLDVFKIGPYNYQAIYDSWPDAPVFSGKVKKDLAVNVWLAEMKEGCKKRKVPKGLWHRVAQNYLCGRAKRRFEDLKKVMKNMHGGRYYWNWKKFKIAMRNMGWELDSKLTQAWTIGSVPSGVWWIIGKAASMASATPPPPPTRQPFLMRPLKSSVGVVKPRTVGSQKPLASCGKRAVPGAPKPSEKRSLLKSVPALPFGQSNSAVHSVLISAPLVIAATTRTTHVPIWLLNASHSLDVLIAEHPKTMCALSAILVALGSVPSVPEVASGGAGTFLASGTAQAIGGVVVGVGNWLGSQMAPENASTTR